MLTDRHGGVYREVVRQMGRDGWLGVGWPAEYGGRGLGQVEQQIFANEAARADVPLPAVTLQTVGPTLQAHGTQEQKDFFLPRILAGEVHFAIGYTEPEAGTDLAALRTRAVRDGDSYVVNGQKIFTTGAHDADYIWLACRTDPGRARAQGDLHPDRGHRRSRVLLDADHHPRRGAPRQRDLLRRRAGPGHHAGRGGERGLAAGDHPAQPRAGDARPGRAGSPPCTTGCATGPPAGPGPDGRPLLAQPDVRRALGQTYASLRVNELLNWQVAAAATVDIADASATKVFASERLQQLGQLLEDVVGRHGDPADRQTAELCRWLDIQAKRNTVLTFGGGVNEIQRELIATAGLGLPRVPAVSGRSVT